MENATRPYAAFGRRLREAREAKGWAQRHLAHAIGTTSTTISAYENGRRMPQGKRLRQIAVALDVTVDWLLAEEST